MRKFALTLLVAILCVPAVFSQVNVNEPAGPPEQEVHPIDPNSTAGPPDSPSGSLTHSHFRLRKEIALGHMHFEVDDYHEFGALSLAPLLLIPLLIWFRIRRKVSWPKIRLIVWAAIPLILCYEIADEDIKLWVVGWAFVLALLAIQVMDEHRRIKVE